MNIEEKNDLEDLVALKKFVSADVFKGEKIKAIITNWDSIATTASIVPVCPDACIKYKEASKILGCSVGHVKNLTYQGRLVPFIHRGGQRASGVCLSSVNALVQSATATSKYAKPSASRCDIAIPKASETH